MISTKLASIGLASSLVAVLLAMPAQAGAPRTFVSAAGTDNSTCSFAAPCRHFQAAVDATSAGGEVDALDPAGYGPITISQAITIEGQGWSYIAPPANGNGITINAVSGKVTIRGVSLNGVGIANANGIVFNTGDGLTIQNSVVRNCANNGIIFQPATASQLLVSNTIVSDNALTNSIGIAVQPHQTSHVTLNRVELAGNYSGLIIDGNSLPNNGVGWVSVNDSTISGSAAQGISAFNTSNPNAHSFITAIVTRSSIVDGANTGIVSQGTGVVVQLNQSTIANNGAGWSIASGGTVTSFGNNAFSDNAATGDGPPTLRTLE